MDRSEKQSTLPLLIAILASVSVRASAGHAGWAYPPPQPLRVHVCRGLWSRDYRVEEAIALGGGGLVSDSWHHVPGGFGWLGPWGNVGGSLWNFPGSAQQIASHHVIVLCHINAAALKKHRQEQLRDYVRNGGAVLLLGGRFAFGSQYHNTPLAEIAPVTFVAKGLDLQKSMAALEPGDADALGGRLRSLRWEQRPLNYWHHNVTPRDGAIVALAAGGNPLLILGQAGRGRVAVFAGSVMGASEEGQLPFWKWGDWPLVLSLTIRWLAESSTNAPHGLDEATVERLKEIADTDEIDFEAEDDAEKRGAKQKDQAALLMSAASRCHDAKSARLFLQAVAGFEGDLPAGLPVAASRAMRPHVDRSFAPLAEKLAASGRLHKTALGLRVLGMANAPNAESALERYYASGKLSEVEKGEAPKLSVESLMTPSPEASPAGEDAGQVIRHAAVAGLANLQDGKALQVLQGIVRRTAEEGRYRGTHLEHNFEEIISGPRRLHQEAVLGMLRCGEAGAAEEVVDFLIENIYVYIRARMERNKPEDRLDRVIASVGSSMDWQQQLYETLATVPDGVLPALARRIASAEERRIAPAALAVFAGRKLPPELAAILRKSTVPAVAALAAQR